MGGEEQTAGAAAPGRAPRFWGWAAPTPRALHSAGWVLLPLRAFLGVTFLFAGLQKLANPAFFKASNPVSIQAQLAGAARHSPLHGLLIALGHAAIPLGLLIAVGELAVGLGTLVGLWARVAAVGGALISLGLFLTVSFHANPYYTGSDIVFLAAWTPLVAAGAGPLSVDGLLSNVARRAGGLAADVAVPMPFSQVRLVCGSYAAGACAARRGGPCEPGPCPFLAASWPRRTEIQDVERRAFLAKAAATVGLGALGLVGAAMAAGIGRLAGGSSRQPTVGALRPGKPARRSPPSSSPGSSAAPPSTEGSPPPTTAAPAPPGTRLGPASAVPVGGAASFTDPKSGDPALVVQPQRGTFRAFDAVCPHAGCTVHYASASRIFVCPCHGSEFNGQTGAVEVGPAESGLSPIPIAEGADGQLYAR